jgi:hypothetical protein
MEGAQGVQMESEQEEYSDYFKWPFWFSTCMNFCLFFTASQGKLSESNAFKVKTYGLHPHIVSHE